MVEQFGTVGFDGTGKTLDDVFLLNPGNQKLVTGKRNWRYVFRQVVLPSTPFVLLLLILGLISGPTIVNEIRLSNAETKTTEAKVVDNRVSRGKSTSYYITYEIKLDGAEYRREEQVSRDEYDRSRTGDYVTVTYATNNPNVSHIGGRGINWNSLIPGVVLLGFIVIFGGIASWGVIPHVQHMKRLKREGQMLTGELLWSKSELVKRGSGKSRRTDLDLTIGYRFRTPTGRTIETQITKVRNDLKKKPLPERGRMAVLYVSEIDYEVL